ncbi:recombinase family protein [Leifsonia sp. H3M29-4]|jgi:DNA invertase Pin-like site-specific DNA recombinase|uniref:recombinase family protein n=1 Tax=Salinibacterium metalliresistens TaxID=3031321 RepID=UPI0023DB4564|nr:recombinase family protein [Salinibacterium metalliresistens]MDF1480331.1 recombinase family protein [Salinibacterium metalliresistens]
MLIGYARVSTDAQDNEAQYRELLSLGCDPDRIYFDHGRTGANRSRGGLTVAMAACRRGDRLVVTKLDRLARSLSDLLAIADELQATGVTLQHGHTVYDPLDPIGKMVFQVLGVFAEFEREILRARTREGMAIARSKGRLKGKQPKLTGAQDRHVLRRYEDKESVASIAESFNVSRAAIYRSIERAKRARTESAGAPVSAGVSKGG